MVEWSYLSRSSSKPVAQRIRSNTTCSTSHYVALTKRCTGAPPHNAGIVSNFLNTMFPNRWIGNKSPIQWAPILPDLNPLDFYFWGNIKQEVYSRQMVQLIHKKS